MPARFLATAHPSADSQRHKQAHVVFFTVCLLAVFLGLCCYLPSAGPFAVRSSFFALFIVGLLAGGALALIGAWAALLSLPPQGVCPGQEGLPNYLPTSLNDPLAIGQEAARSPSGPEYDWRQDATNPMSPLYQAWHNSRHEG